MVQAPNQTIELLHYRQCLESIKLQNEGFIIVCIITERRTCISEVGRRYCQGLRVMLTLITFPVTADD